MKELMYKRYSSRKYSQEKVSTQDINTIVECMLLSPSAKNKNPWDFIVIHDLSLIKALADSKVAGAKFLDNTQHVIAVIGHEALSDTWIEDGAITLTIGHLAATSLNLGSCWIQIRNRQAEDCSSEAYVKKLLKIPEDLRVLGLLSIGHAMDENTKEKTPDWTKVHTDIY